MASENSENITYRLPRITSSLNDVSEGNSSLFDSTMISLPNTSLNDSETVSELNEKVRTLSTALSSAHQEIENLNIEVTKLKLEVQKCVKVIESYKKIHMSDTKILTPISGRKKKQIHSEIRTPVKKQLLITPMHNANKVSKSKLESHSSTSSPMDGQLSAPSTCSLINIEHPLTTQVTQADFTKTESDPGINPGIRPVMKVLTSLTQQSISSVRAVSQSKELESPPPNEHTQPALANDLTLNVVNEVATATEIPDIKRMEDLNMINLESGQPKEQDTRKKADTKVKRKIVVIAEDQGRHIQQTLQTLIGEEFLVCCYWKPGASLGEVLGSYKNDISKLNSNDFVIVLGGTNDKYPDDFQFWIRHFLMNVNKTNVIVSEVPFNRFLNVNRLNHKLKFVCSKFRNTSFVDMNRSSFIPGRISLVSHKCQILLQQVLRIDYRVKYNNYITMARKQKVVTTADKSVQTDECDMSKVAAGESSQAAIPDVGGATDISRELFRL